MRRLARRIISGKNSPLASMPMPAGERACTGRPGANHALPSPGCRDRARSEEAMKKYGTAIAMVTSLAVFGAVPVSAADTSKVDDASRQVESGAKTTGEGIKETAKGLGQTVTEGAKTAGDRLKEAGRAAKPE